MRKLCVVGDILEHKETGVQYLVESLGSAMCRAFNTSKYYYTNITFVDIDKSYTVVDNIYLKGAKYYE